MKVNVDRLFMDNHGRMVKKLSLILELDAIKSMAANSVQDCQYADGGFVDEEGVHITGETCVHVTIKWVDGEESTYHISEVDYNFLLDYISMVYKNSFTNELAVFEETEEILGEGEEEEYDEEYDDEEEVDNEQEDYLQQPSLFPDTFPKVS